jgi:hypothetical protein
MQIGSRCRPRNASLTSKEKPRRSGAATSRAGHGGRTQPGLGRSQVPLRTGASETPAAAKTVRAADGSSTKKPPAFDGGARRSEPTSALRCITASVPCCDKKKPRRSDAVGLAWRDVAPPDSDAGQGGESQVRKFAHLQPAISGWGETPDLILRRRRKKPTGRARGGFL